MLTVSTTDYLWFVDQALDQMTAIVHELGDDLANTRPALDGANSPFAILTHCLGVMEHWVGDLVGGRTIERDRDAEFVAVGAVDALLERVTTVRRQFETDLAGIEPLAPLRHAVHGPDAELPIGLTQGGAAWHVYEELSQHLGQMELSRDVLLAAR